MTQELQPDNQLFEYYELGGRQTQRVIQFLDAGVPTPLNSLSVWQPGEDVNDLGESIDQPMELMEGGDREGDTEGVELEVRGLEFMDEEEEVDETEPESEGDESGWRA